MLAHPPTARPRGPRLRAGAFGHLPERPQTPLVALSGVASGDQGRGNARLPEGSGGTAAPRGRPPAWLRPNGGRSCRPSGQRAEADHWPALPKGQTVGGSAALRGQQAAAAQRPALPKGRTLVVLPPLVGQLDEADPRPGLPLALAWGGVALGGSLDFPLGGPGGRPATPYLRGGAWGRVPGRRRLGGARRGTAATPSVIPALALVRSQRAPGLAGLVGPGVAADLLVVPCAGMVACSSQGTLFVARRRPRRADPFMAWRRLPFHGARSVQLAAVRALLQRFVALDDGPRAAVFSLFVIVRAGY